MTEYDPLAAEFAALLEQTRVRPPGVTTAARTVRLRRGRRRAVLAAVVGVPALTIGAVALSAGPAPTPTALLDPSMPATAAARPAPPPGAASGTDAETGVTKRPAGSATDSHQPPATPRSAAAATGGATPTATAGVTLEQLPVGIGQTASRPGTRNIAG